MSTLPASAARADDPSVRRMATFALLACGFSWALWLPSIASQRGWVAFHFFSGPWGSFGPAIAGLVMAWRTGEPLGLRAQLRTLVVYRGAARWLAIAAGLPLAATVVGIAAHRVLSGPLPALAVDKLIWAPAIIPLILILGGPLGEEPGWRGYLVPMLSRRYGLLSISGIVAVVWLVWHLPLFWMEGAAQEGTSLALFGVTVLAYSVIFTWLYLATAPSLVPVLVLHTAVNVLSFGMPYVLPGVGEGAVFEPASTAVILLVAGWLALRGGVLGAAAAAAG